MKDMQGNKAAFYCMSCREMKERQDGALVFRTGFYRVRYPLGLCASCAAEEQGKTAPANTTCTENSQALA